MHASSKSISGKSGRLKTRSYAMGQWGMRNRKWWVVFRTKWDKEIISNTRPVPLGIWLQGQQWGVTQQQERWGPGPRRCQVSRTWVTISTRRMAEYVFITSSAATAPSWAFQGRGFNAYSPASSVRPGTLWEDTPVTHEHSQGLPWLPTCHLPNLIPWAQTHTHTPRDPSPHSPGLFTELLKGQDSGDSREQESFPLTSNSEALILQGHPSGKGEPSFRISEVGFWWWSFKLLSIINVKRTAVGPEMWHYNNW